MQQGRVHQVAQAIPIGLESHLAILLRRHLHQLAVPGVGVAQLQCALLVLGDPARGHLVGEVLVAGAGVMGGVIGPGQGEGNEPLAPHLVADPQPLLLPLVLPGDAVAAGDPVFVEDAGGQIGHLVGQEGEGEGAAQEPQRK